MLYLGQQSAISNQQSAISNQQVEVWRYFIPKAHGKFADTVD